MNDKKKILIWLPGLKHGKYLEKINALKASGISKKLSHEVAIDLFCELDEIQIRERIANNIKQK